MSNKKKYFTINGTDGYENSYLTIHKENGKIHVYSSEECSDVVLGIKQARELIDAINKCIVE